MTLLINNKINIAEYTLALESSFQHSSLVPKLHIPILSLRASNLSLAKGLINKFANCSFVV